MISTLVMLMGIVFLASNCKGQTQTVDNKVTITYSTEHGTALASKTVDKDYKLVAEDLPNISAEDFVFEGWYIEGTKATVGYVVTKNITLSAKWKAKITITYSTEHGTAPASKTVDKDYKLVAEDLPNISAEDFVFEGWYIGETKASAGYTVTQSIILKAKWDKLQYISFTTSKNIGEKVSFTIDADVADQPDVWIDLNNNGIREVGEDIERFGNVNNSNLQKYIVANQTFRLYGNVTYLYCVGSFTSIDFNGCKALQGLNCYGNQLNTLDVRECKALKSLSCWNNKLTSLDVKECKALQILNCSGNQLDTLDVRECKALQILKCWGNKLTSLEVSECKVLKELACSNNRLTILEVTECKALKYLGCSGNQLETLDVRECKALQDLKCSNNTLTILDVSECKALESLHCESNQLTSLNMSQETKLKKLFIHKNKIQGASMDSLISSLPTVSTTSQNSGEFIIVDNIGMPSEENTYTSQNINDAKAKNWKVYDANADAYGLSKIEL